MASRALKHAIAELGQYFGIRSSDAFLQAILGASDEAAGAKNFQAAMKNELHQVSPESIRADLLDSISGQGDAAPSVAALLSYVAKAAASGVGSKSVKADLKGINQDICITMDSPSYYGDADPAKHPLNVPDANVPGGPDKTQGLFRPEKDSRFYTVADYAVPDEGDEIPETSVHVIQVFPAVGNISVADTNVVSLFMNSIPTLEMSRAVPVIDVTVLVNDVARAEDATREMSLGRHLVGSTMTSDVDKKMFTAEDMTISLAPDTEKEQFRTAATMEIFTSPQTMVPINADGSMRRNHGRDGEEGAPLDPFRPMMSLVSLTVNSVGTQGMHSYKSADMSLVLHDRTQLGNVLPLVSPGQIGNVRLQITYGWSHPDGTIPYGDLPVNANRLADADTNRFADIINSMRVTELFNVVNSDFDFGEDGSININLKLATTGETSIQMVDITLSQIEDSYVKLKELTDAISATMKSFRKRRKKAGKINFPMALQRATNASSAATLKPKDIKELIEFLRKSKDGDLKKIGGFAKKLKKQVTAVSDSKQAAVGRMIQFLKTTPDPYLRSGIGDYTGRVAKVDGKKVGFGVAHDYLIDPHSPAGARTSTAFVSLGKLLSFFVGKALIKTAQFTEIQMIFYAFNDSASHLYDCNIAQFPIRISDLEDVLSKRFSDTGRMTLKQFLQMLDGLFLRDQGAPGYGFGSIYEGRDKKNPRRRKFNSKLYKTKKNKDGEKPPDLIAIQDAKEKELRGAYDLEKDDPGVDFKVPQITLRIESVPMRVAVEDGVTVPSYTGFPGSQNILKIHVMDQKCNTLEGLKSVLDGFSQNGTCKWLKRKDKSLRSSRHGAIYATQLDILSSVPISAISQNYDPTQVAGKLGMEPDQVKRALEGMYLVEVETLTRMKTILSSLFPTFLYGAAHSGIISAKVATENNPALATARMVGASQGKKGNAIDSGLPMFVTPTTLQLETFGCPYFAMGQQYFVDLMTDTQADNFYGVFEVTHNLEAGKFTTNVRMGVMDSFGKWNSTQDNFKELIIGAVPAAKASG